MTYLQKIFWNFTKNQAKQAETRCIVIPHLMRNLSKAVNSSIVKAKQVETRCIVIPHLMRNLSKAVNSSIVKWSLASFAIFVISACGEEVPSSETANQQKPEGQQKPPSQEEKFLDLADATHLGIANQAGVHRLYKIDESGEAKFVSQKTNDSEFKPILSSEPIDLKKFGSDWVAIRFTERPASYNHQYHIGSDDDRLVFVHQSKGDVYLLPEKNLNWQSITQGSENHFYTTQDTTKGAFIFRKLLQIDLSQNKVSLKELTPKGVGAWYVTKNDELFYYHRRKDSFFTYNLHAKFLKENINQVVYDDGTSESNFEKLVSCDGVWTTSFNRENLLCYKSKRHGLATTTTIIQFNLDATASNAIASTTAVTNFFTPRQDDGFYFNNYTRFVRSEKYLLLAQGADELFLSKVYPKGDTQAHHYPEINGTWSRTMNQFDGGAYRIYGDELYLITEKADKFFEYGLWKIDLTNMAAGATEIPTDFATYIKNTVWFTDDKKVLWKGDDVYRVDLNEASPTVKTISKFENEIVRLISLKNDLSSLKPPPPAKPNQPKPSNANPAKPAQPKPSQQNDPKPSNANPAKPAQPKPSQPKPSNPPPAKPAQPTLSQVSVSSIQISWNAVSGATSYQIYRDSVLKKTVTSGTTWTDTITWTSGQPYRYTLKACHQQGCSDFSDETSLSLKTLADLKLENWTVNGSTSPADIEPGKNLTLSVNVKNSGSQKSFSGHVDFYGGGRWSQKTKVGSVSFDKIAAGASVTASKTIAAPTNVGDYEYFAKIRNTTKYASNISVSVKKFGYVRVTLSTASGSFKVGSSGWKSSGTKVKLPVGSYWLDLKNLSSYSHSGGRSVTIRANQTTSINEYYVQKSFSGNTIPYGYQRSASVRLYKGSWTFSLDVTDADCDLYLYDSSGNELKKSENMGRFNEYISYNNTTNGKQVKLVIKNTTRLTGTCEYSKLELD